MKILYRGRFLGQGFALKEGSIVDVVAERENDVLFFCGDFTGWYIPKHMIKKL